ncbi:MAG TPA: glycoside hydrolase family 3 N-terminal domain-containing protein [Patescibacteria group bacterium]|nr:glycoside hydrolase family 3 N-terminal domain-containing protein [Patescibacteria group bacterium]
MKLKVLWLILLWFVNFSKIVASAWAETTLSQMSLREKIGQLFVVAAVSSFPPPRSPYCMEKENIERMIQDYYIGGLLFLFRSTPLAQVELFNHYNILSKIPLWTLQDCEWGLNMRLDDTICFPKQMTLGAIQDDILLVALGNEIGRQCKAVGIDMNLGPVADINTNSANPIIGNRSFGSVSSSVAKKVCALMKGMQESGIVTCAKHFPGHGDTIIDSHHSIPIINHDIARLHKVELIPFKSMIQNKVEAIMVGHLLVPSYDKDEVASLSRNIVTDLLKKQMSFNGLVVTDGLGMSAVYTDQKEPGTVELQAFLAGNDILLAPINVPAAIKKIEAAVMEDQNLLNDLDHRVLKILKLKEKFNIHERTEIEVINLQEKLHTVEASALKKQLYQNALTLAVGTLSNIYFTQENSACILQIGGQPDSCFAQTIQSQVLTMHMTSPAQPSLDECNMIAQKLKAVDTVLLTFFDVHNDVSTQCGISSEVLQLFQQLKNDAKKVVVILFGTPYAVPFFKNADAVLVGYENDIDAQKAAAEVVLRKQECLGKLPVHFE